jgi:hypothetical protein
MVTSFGVEIVDSAGPQQDLRLRTQLTPVDSEPTGWRDTPVFTAQNQNLQKVWMTVRFRVKLSSSGVQEFTQLDFRGVN